MPTGDKEDCSLQKLPKEFAPILHCFCQVACKIYRNDVLQVSAAAHHFADIILELSGDATFREDVARVVSEANGGMHHVVVNAIKFCVFKDIPKDAGFISQSIYDQLKEEPGDGV